MAKNSTGRPSRAGAVRRGTKGAKAVGSGGQGRQALEGKKPTPKAEDRPYHPAGKAKAARERFAAAGGKGRPGARSAGDRSRDDAQGGRPAPARRVKKADDSEIVTGRNSVVEALRAKIPATALYVAFRVEVDERVKEALSLATKRGIPVMEVMRPELDRLSGHDAVHQGLALKVPPYEYAHPETLLDQVQRRGQKPLFVALDGITDPRNLGAIIRSTAAFGGQGVIVPQRRSVGVTASAWKTSAGAAATTPVAMASNLTQTLKAFKAAGVFVVGLDGGGDTDLPGLDFADGPIVVVVGNEGKGLSRLVTETCDAIVSIPISSGTESLNAGIAASVTLYEIARQRGEKKATKAASKAAAYAAKVEAEGASTTDA
ncbi:23S rRNA (guanosine(2251)-2'-O)-methyltransferase RlmB [Herbiconiux sp. CPCC 203407]|uniref:23S rRNA (Guanosine(2251)-2'-O)-methyltransferase RlmB n=1 Tax=Herbiconiux oxytropis TaxID=2970915 RepID=A0AA41XAQ7_9MICO|nr:23S rRNA (guanosine(2251)-2'-O)-methyltransferase RlmB [Herbiconiux oxytropis]MCS5721089.1 23S rRNA (guanosine(2251)-2'-O)-methyltransferase RlmB [Herbiconiux oxytropis]MCS5724741.1 23S rRNA (guanosine(2251)-2'-O)-methyltransferase RlmB [Herbiconiux oxytropis]